MLAAKNYERLSHKKRNRLLKDYEVANLEYEYPGYEGEYRYFIYTPMPEELLLEKHGAELRKYEPYLIIAGDMFAVRVELTRAEDNFRSMVEKHECPFEYEEGKSESMHPELCKGDTLQVLIEAKAAEQRAHELEQVREALDLLTPTQKRRVIGYFYENKSSRTIAAEEGVNYSKVDNSIKAALKKMRKYLEEGGARASAHS